MKIQVTHAGTNYTIDADGTCFTVIRHGINQNKDGKHFGEPTESVLSYPTSLSGAVQRIIKDQIGLSDEVLTLKQYVERVEAANAEIKDQLHEVA